LGLSVVKLLFKFRNTLNLIFNFAVSCDTFFLFQLAHQFIDVSRSLFQNLLCSIKYRYFSFDLSEYFFHVLKLVIFNAESRSVLSEIVAFYVFRPLLAGVLLFLVTHVFLKS